MRFLLTTSRRHPAVTPALALALALALASCGRPDPPGTARSGTTGRSPASASTPVAARDPATAAPADTVALYPAADLARIAGALGNGATGRTLGATPAYSFIQGRRTTSGGPERHERWTDIALVQAGRATLLTGGRIAGGRDASPGELRGGAIIGGSEHVIAAGDLVVIPAGTPHQYRLAPGETLTYLTIKVPPGR